MSSEHRRTALVLAPLPAPLGEVYGATRAHLQRRRRAVVVPEAIEALTVERASRRFRSRRPADRVREAAAPRTAQADEEWTCAACRIRIGGGAFSALLCMHEPTPGESWVQLQFASYMYESIYQWDADETAVDEAAKADLIGFCVETARALRAPGFGLRWIGDVEIPPAPPFEELRAWVTQDVSQRGEVAWILAGVDRGAVPGFEPEQLGLGDVVRQRDGYLVYDLLWPSPLNP